MCRWWAINHKSCLAIALLTEYDLFDIIACIFRLRLAFNNYKITKKGGLIMIWRYIEPPLIVMLAIFLFTQVALPPFIGKPFFWIFRKSEKQLREKDKELAEVKTKLAIKEKDRVITRIRRDLDDNN